MKSQYKLVRELAAGEAVDDTPEVSELVAEFNLDVISENGRSRLSQPMELLDPAVLEENLSTGAKGLLSGLDLHWSLDSTNTFVLNLSREEHFHGYACMAERQTAGKGRRGRSWVSPFGKNIYLSLGWRLPGDQSLDGLSLAVGCACVRAIRSVSADIEVKLKWPNDLLIGGGKAGGILVELGQSSNTHHNLVIGIGINLQLSEQDSSGIDQPWSVVRGVSRNSLAGALISELAQVLSVFSAEGFAPLQAEWNELDAFANQIVCLSSAGAEREGIARGVDEAGHLLLDVDGELVRINAGEVSMRGVQA